MLIKILGTRGEIEASKPYHSRHSGVLIDKNILFDVGEKEYLKLKPEYIFITHLHPDHAFFLRNHEDLEREYFYPGNFKNKKKIADYRIWPIPTHHSIKVDSQAYLIQKDSKRLLYTGDLVWIDKKYHHFIEDLDVVITEGSFIRKGGMIRKDKKTNQIYGHQGIPGLIKLLGKFTKRIVFMHFGSWFYKDIPTARKRISNLSDEIELVAAYDGYEFRV